MAGLAGGRTSLLNVKAGADHEIAQGQSRPDNVGHVFQPHAMLMNGCAASSATEEAVLLSLCHVDGEPWGVTLVVGVKKPSRS